MQHDARGARCSGEALVVVLVVVEELRVLALPHVLLLLQERVVGAERHRPLAELLVHGHACRDLGIGIDVSDAGQRVGVIDVGEAIQQQLMHIGVPALALGVVRCAVRQR